jgi:hypothetical protein
MGIDTGFAFDGFVDDRQEKEMWGNIDKKLTKSATEPAKEDNEFVDGTMEVSDNGKSDWEEEMQKSSIKEYKKKNLSNNQGFFQRNKKQIFDALILLGIVYVGYKLFFEKEDGRDFDHGGEVDQCLNQLLHLHLHHQDLNCLKRLLILRNNVR